MTRYAPPEVEPPGEVRSSVSESTWANITAVHADTFTVAMEQLQESYVTAVAATAGCTAERKDRDVHGADMEIIRPAEPPAQEVALLVQLKATTQIAVPPTGAEFSYQFSKRKYLERLAAPRRSPKLILVVMLCPSDQSQWTTCDHHQLTLRHCCYWVSLEGNAIASDVQRPSIRVPTANIFDADALRTIMDKLDEGVPLR